MPSFYESWKLTTQQYRWLSFMLRRISSGILIPGKACTRPSSPQGQLPYRVLRSSPRGKPNGSERWQQNLVSTSKNNLVWECFSFPCYVMKTHTYSEYKSVAKTPVAAKTLLLQKALPVCPDSLSREKQQCGAGRPQRSSDPHTRLRWETKHMLSELDCSRGFRTQGSVLWPQRLSRALSLSEGCRNCPGPCEGVRLILFSRHSLIQMR